MADVFFDMRSRAIRLLVSDGGQVLCCRSYKRAPDSDTLDSAAVPLTPTNYYRLFEDSPRRSGVVGEIIDELGKELNLRLDRAFVIPSLEVMPSVQHRMPKMATSDAEKIIARRAATENRGELPIIRLTELNADQNGRTYLAEQLSRDAVSLMQRQFSTGRMKLASIGSSFSSTLAAFEPVRQEMMHPHAILDINTDSVQAFYVNSSELIHYECVTLPPEQEGETEASDDDPEAAARRQRKMMFRIINTLHMIHSRYMTARPHFPVTKVWLCGMACNDREIVEALGDAMDAEVVRADFLQREDVDGHEYVALLGLANSLDRETLVDFIPDDMRSGLRISTESLLAVTAVLSAAIMLIGYFSTESRFRALKTRVAREKAEVAALRASNESTRPFARNMESIKGLTGSQVGFYGIFRSLAARLPEGTFLDRFEFRQKDGNGSLDLTVAVQFRSEMSRNRILSRVKTVFDDERQLRRVGEPEISVKEQEGDRLILLKLAYEVKPFEK